MQFFFQMDGVLELYPLGLEELAGVGYTFGRVGMSAPNSQHLAHTQASKTALSPFKEFCGFPDGLLVCGAVPGLYPSCW